MNTSNVQSKKQESRKNDSKNSPTCNVVENQELGISLHVFPGKKIKASVFIGKEIAESLGHTNLTQAIKDAKLVSGKDYVIVEKKKHPEFFKQLTKERLVSPRAGSITMLYQSGVDLLVLNSEKEEGSKVKRWLVDVVFPSLREKGYYNIQNQMPQFKELGKHLDVAEQKKNSIEINYHNYKTGGVEKIIDYNAKSCYEFTGKFPKEIKEEAKNAGLPSKDRTSAKAVIRKMKPAIACAMSFTDNMVVTRELDFKKIAEVAKQHLIPVYDFIIEQGITPPELQKAS